MNLRISTAGALGVAAALSLGAATSGVAQDTTSTMRDSTQRRGVTSSRRIPLRKDGGTAGQTQTSGGEVSVAITQDVLTTQLNDAMTAERARVDSMFAADRTRLDQLSTQVSGMDTRINGVNDAVTGVRRDVDALRTSQLALSDSLNRLRMRFDAMRNRSLFGHSGFYVGLGLGGNFPNGTLSDIGYDQGLHVAVPIGWQRPASMLGLRVELAAQTLDGLPNAASASGFSNRDPQIWSGVGMLTLNFPYNARRTNSFYLLGGGGAYMFRKFGGGSALAQYLGDDIVEQTDEANEKNVTKWGVTGGAGLQFGLVGPTSLFVESRFTNVFGNKNNATGGGNTNLRFVPVLVGITLH